MYHHTPNERESSNPVSIQRLPSFRNFELPRLSFPRFASSKTLNNAYRGELKDGDLERQELQPLSPHQEEGLKWEQEYNQEAEEDPNLVRTTPKLWFLTNSDRLRGQVLTIR